MKSPKLNGLHLWAIYTHQNSDSQLWITTVSKNANHAIDKAVMFVRKERGWPNLKVTIKSLNYHGTIDA